MKALYNQSLFSLLLLCSLLFLGSSSKLEANDKFFDYLPKYRKFNSNYQIDKIEYREKRTVIYFRFVVEEDNNVAFYSGSHPNAWYLRTPPRMRGIEVQFKLMEITDIRVNNEVKVDILKDIPEIEYEMKRGDVVTCEMHFARIPHYIRMLDLIEGANGDMDNNGFNCFDILIKTAQSPLLGKESEAQKNTQRFESTFTYLQPKTASQPLAAKEDSPKEANNTHMAEPIDYRPQAMTDLADIRCNKRVILPSISFKEDAVNFNGRVRSMQDIKTLRQYLENYPSAIIRLHGHTDIFGDDIRNLQLSRERAMAVKLELVKMGIDRDRIEILFYGGRQPLQGLEEGGIENRRVEAEAICTDQ